MGSQKNGEPPVTVTVASPSQIPRQEASALAVIVAVSTAGSLIVTDITAIHPFASVTVTV